ncbi:MAG: hypothetical protein AAGK03_03755 [Pseudomonadota bacterium]
MQNDWLLTLERVVVIVAGIFSIFPIYQFITESSQRALDRQANFIVAADICADYARPPVRFFEVDPGQNKLHRALLSFSDEVGQLRSGQFDRDDHAKRVEVTNIYFEALSGFQIWYNCQSLGGEEQFQESRSAWAKFQGALSAFRADSLSVGDTQARRMFRELIVSHFYNYGRPLDFNNAWRYLENIDD